MRKIPVENAIGITLCHDMTAILEGGIKGARFKRGHMVLAEDIPVMLSMGKSHIFIWDADSGEVHEEDAARALADVLTGENIQVDGPSEGKFRFTANANGLFRVNTEALAEINAVPDYTVATRPGNTTVKTGDLLAGARIVPLTTNRANVDAAVKVARENAPILTVLPFLPLKTGIIITGGEVFYGRIPDRFEPVMRKKLEPFGAEVLGVVKCPDELPAISRAIADFIAQGARLILLTGGMSVDPDDLTPTAIRMSGASVVTHGTPMQPGNMLMVAYLNGTTLIGVPGASLHSPITSLDIFLPRVFADVPITKSDIVKMGDGGLCVGCPVCTYPICYFGRG